MDCKLKARLLKIRKEKKSKKPSFIRYESWRYVRLSISWRKQRGLDNKTRHKLKEGIKSPHPGYQGPHLVRGLHPSGLEDVLVIHPEQLKGLSPKVHGIRIAAKLGARKRLILVEQARDAGFTVLNLGISKDEIKNISKKESEKAGLSNKQAQIQKIRDGKEKGKEKTEEKTLPENIEKKE